LLKLAALIVAIMRVNDSYLKFFSTKAKVDCLYFDISRFIIRCRL